MSRWCRLFRNNVGLFKTFDGRRIKTGLCNGSSDIIGWTPVTVTEDMVGDTVAVFTAIEVKKPNGRATDQQLNFIDNVRVDGGYAGIAKSTEDAEKIIGK
jgi:hypothetical protein